MQNIVEIMKENGIEVTDEQGRKIEQALLANYVTKSEHKKKIQAAEEERDNFKDKYEEAEKTLKEFDGVEDKIKGYEQTISEMEETYKKESYVRDFSNALDEALKEVEFSSEYAKKSVIEELNAAELKLVDGKIVGLQDMLDNIREKDQSAFVDKEQKKLEANRPRFTNAIKDKNEDDNTEISIIRKAMGLPAEGSK